MTARLEYELSCDGPPGAGPFHCPTAPIFDRSIAEARRTAASQGWVVVHWAGKLVDLCPEHKNSPRPPAQRGECAVCGLECRLILSGVVRSHKQRHPGSQWARKCAGSGKAPKASAGEVSHVG